MTAAVRLDPQTLTAMQAAVLGYVYCTIRDRGYQPTFRGIAKHFGFRSAEATRHHLTALDRKGWIALTVKSGHRGASRALRLFYRPDGLPFEGFGDRPPLETEVATHAPRRRHGRHATGHGAED